MRRVGLLTALVVAAGLALAGCSSKKESNHGFASRTLDPFAGTGSPYYKGSGKVPMGGGRYHVGKPYQVAGRWFTPKEQPGYDKKGPASWYGEAFHRRKTSNGEWFDMTKLTAAHPTLPLPSYAKVTNLENGREVIVRINDRGPFVGPRIIDLSKHTAEVLDFKNKGKTTVRVQYIGKAPLNDNGTHLANMNRELTRGTPLKRMIAAANNGGAGQTYAQAEPEPQIEQGGYQQASYSPPETARSAGSPFGAADTSGVYYIQIGTFSNPDNAERLRQQLNGIGPVSVTELVGGNGAVYRVRMGPVADAGEAQSMLDQVYGRGLTDAHLIKAQIQETAAAP
jgi:rare lipoprotein A